MSGIKFVSVIKTFERFEYRVVRQSKHVILRKGEHSIAIPRSNEVNPLIIRRLLKECHIQYRAFLEALT